MARPDELANLNLRGKQSVGEEINEWKEGV